MRSANVPQHAPGRLGRHLSGLCDGITRGLAYLDLTTPRATYVMRSMLAAGLALVVAFGLGLHAPYSAASSVLLVISPLQGAVMGKATWRVLGTLAGMFAAFVLMSAFAQMPWLFILGFGVWLGICVAGMTLLRHFRAYGAALAGYTVGLAAYGALQHPELAFDQILGRGACVVIGVVCLAVVSALLSTRSVRQRLTLQLHALAAATAATLATTHAAMPGGSGALDADRRNLILTLYAVDDLLAVGKAESAELAQRAGTVRQAMVCLFSAVVSGAPSLAARRASRAALQSLQPAWEAAWQQAGQALTHGGGPEGLAQATQTLSNLRATLHDKLATIWRDDAREQATLMITVDRLIEPLDDYLQALRSMACLHQPRPRAARVSVPFHRDTGAAMQNGLRALLTVLAGGAFWIATGWSQGALMLAGLAACCALLSTAPNPALGAVAFIQGTVLAVVMAFLCAFVILPHIEGLPLLLVTLALFWLPGIYATTLPRHALAGVAYLVAFTSLAAPDNPMHYDLAPFLNAALAWVLATCFALLGFRVVLPRNVSRDADRLRATLRDEAVGTFSAAHMRARDARAWQWRQQHRMAQLGALLKTEPAAMDPALSHALADIHLGREVLRLRAGLRRAAKGSYRRQVLARVLGHMRRRMHEPRLAARHARRAATALSRRHANAADEPAEDRRLGAVLLDIATLLETHADHFSTHSGTPVHAQ